MHKVIFSLVIFFFVVFQVAIAQQPNKPSAVDIYNQIQKLNFLGSVLYVAAHPDDENTRLISYFSNKVNARTAYLSLTRGDGGQNLIGPQLREQLGVIRTQELIEARKIDGGEQIFTRANDFGYSKNPNETFEVWDRDLVLADVVYAVRKFQPDIIINRFDHRTAGNTHGHHTASAILSVESFGKANDSNVFPEQLSAVKPWQTKRIFFNPSWWFYGSQEKFNAADKSSFISIQTGVYYPLIGKSNQEISALSRSCHKSQGFGAAGSRGEEIEYLEPISDQNPRDMKSLFEGIDTSWNRLKGGKVVGDMLRKVIDSFDFTNPSASVPGLLQVYATIQNLEDSQWKLIKLEDLKNVLSACSGLYLEAVAEQQEVIAGNNLKLNLELINRSDIAIELVNVITLPDHQVTSKTNKLLNNSSVKLQLDIKLPSATKWSQPYWLEEKGTTGMYSIPDQKMIGLPDVIREAKVIFNIKIEGIQIPFERTVLYKYTDDVKGEKYNFLDIVPDVSVSFAEKVTLFKTTSSKQVAVTVKALRDQVQGNLILELTKKWRVNPATISFSIDKKGSEQTFYFEVSPPVEKEGEVAKAVVILGGKRFDMTKVSIDYDHICKQQVLIPAESKLLHADLKINNERIAYIMGAGDEVHHSLLQMGYQLSIVRPDEITADFLTNFDVVITGIRAYNTVQELKHKQEILFDFVKSGKTMIVQYNTSSDLVTSDLAPFPLKISSDRVTDENAQVRFLVPNHPVLNSPNKISSSDFKGWTQEQGLYYPTDFGTSFTPILSANDKGESPKVGALLATTYGKGCYIYTGLSFFRQLPAGVSGAYRLLANMISLKNPNSTTTDKP